MSSWPSTCKQWPLEQKAGEGGRRKCSLKLPPGKTLQQAPQAPTLPPPGLGVQAVSFARGCDFPQRLTGLLLSKGLARETSVLCLGPGVSWQ